MCSFKFRWVELLIQTYTVIIILFLCVCVFIISTAENNSTGISSCYSNITRLPNEMVCYRKSPYIHCTDKEYYITGKYIRQHDSAATRGRELHLRSHKRVWDRCEAVLGRLIRLSILTPPEGVLKGSLGRGLPPRPSSPGPVLRKKNVYFATLFV